MQIPDTSAPAPQPTPSAQTGRYTAYAFALLVSAFLGWQCISADKRNEQLSPLVFMPCLTLIGLGLGVQIDPSSITSLLNGGKS